MENKVNSPFAEMEAKHHASGSRLLAQISFDQNFPDHQKIIMNNLITAALAEGVFQGNGFNGISMPAHEGSAADYVVFTTAGVNFVTKIQQDKRIIEEAQFLKMLHIRPDLPFNFAKHFPRVYTIKDDKPPYAYTMERFNMKSFSHYLFNLGIHKNDAAKSLHGVLKILFPAYLKTKNKFLRPSIREVYFDRINSRLKEARQVNTDFNRLSRDRIVINGVTYEPPEHYMDQINKNFKEMLVPFSTFVHGDSHLENILLDFDKRKSPTIKFIDPRGWYLGDYLFDMGKIAHFLFATGPIEKAQPPPVAVIDLPNSRLNYELDLNTYHIPYLLKLFTKWIAEFAREIDDHTWERRYSLSLAANLLGTPAARLKSLDPSKINAAFLLYGEGLIQLAKCCE